MSWCRIHDAALSHPKISALSDRAFRLWVWGLSYAQQHLTDGKIAATAPMPEKLRRGAAELAEKGLWESLNAQGYQIHDYLEWNDSRAEVLKKRSSAKERMSFVRSRTSERTPLIEVPSGVERIRSFPERESEGKPPPDHDLGQRAANFCDRFVELYAKHRNGARYHIRPSLDWTIVLELLGTWDEARLEKIAVILLTTDDPWIADTGRGIGVLRTKASWCDDRLRAWEAEHQVQV